MCMTSCKLHVLVVGQAGLAGVPVPDDRLHVLVENRAALGGGGGLKGYGVDGELISLGYI